MQRNNKIKRADKPSAKRKNRFLLIFVSVFLSLVMILGITLGIIYSVRAKKAAVRYDGVNMDIKVAYYLASYYKYNYMQSLSKIGIKNVEDSPGFWNTLDEDGVSYAEHLAMATDTYIKQVVAASHIYDENASLSAEDKEKINFAAKAALEYKAEGKESVFNAEANRYGFDYDSFKSALTFIYKSSKAQSLVYGSDGGKLAYYPTLTEEYYSEYVHTYILMIRTETKYYLDKDGNKVVNGDNEYELITLTPEEKQARTALVEEIRELIKGYNEDADVQMSPVKFSEYLAKHNDGEDELDDGYYFHTDSYFTKSFPVEEVLDLSYELEIGEYGEVTVGECVFFIYRDELTQYAYSSGRSADCFDDFYSNASDKFFMENLQLLSEDVELTKLYKEINLVSLPFNYKFLPTF